MPSEKITSGCSANIAFGQSGHILFVKVNPVSADDAIAFLNDHMTFGIILIPTNVIFEGVGFNDPRFCWIIVLKAFHDILDFLFLSLKVTGQYDQKETLYKDADRDNSCWHNLKDPADILSLLTFHGSGSKCG